MTKGPFKDELASRNTSRNGQLWQWLSAAEQGEALKRYPAELMFSLIIGASESYCRAWLAGRVSSSPKVHRQLLAQAAWRSISAE
ncbi:hypothetical protein J3P79_10275 [Pseudomonas sp. R1-7]